MAEHVGFITNMKPEWMDLAYRCRIDGLTKEDAKPIIEETLALSYKSRENKLKTRRELETMFYDSPSWLLEDSLSVYRTLTEEQRLPLYWSLLISSFPIVYDTCKSIGTIAEYRDVVTLAQARQPVYEQWGARNIVHQAVTKIFQTLKDFGIIVPMEKAGTFTIKKRVISDTRLVNYMAVAVLMATDVNYMTWENIAGNRSLFPFTVEHVTQADAATCEKLCLERMGDDVVIRVKD